MSKQQPTEEDRNNYNLLPQLDCWKEAAWSRSNMPYSMATKFVKDHAKCTELFKLGQIRECTLNKTHLKWKDAPEEYGAGILKSHPNYLQVQKTFPLSSTNCYSPCTLLNLLNNNINEIVYFSNDIGNNS